MIKQQELKKNKKQKKSNRMLILMMSILEWMKQQLDPIKKQLNLKPLIKFKLARILALLGTILHIHKDCIIQICFIFVNFAFHFIKRKKNYRDMNRNAMPFCRILQEMKYIEKIQFLYGRLMDLKIQRIYINIIIKKH